MKYLFTILIALLLIGCCASRRPLATTVNTLDSTHVKQSIRVRDTLVKIPFYKVSVGAAIKDLTEKPIIKNNGRAGVSLWKKNDSIYATAVCDSLELQLQLRDSIIDTYRERSVDSTITLPPVEVKYTPWYTKTLAWIGGIWLLTFGIRTALKFYKP